MHKHNTSHRASKKHGDTILKRVWWLGLGCSLAGCASSPLGEHFSAQHMAGKARAPHASIAQRAVHSVKQPLNHGSNTSLVQPASHQEFDTDPHSGPAYSVPLAGACADDSPTSGDSYCMSGRCAPGGCQCQSMQCSPMQCLPMPGMPQYWNDQEYIYDGGDREPKVQVTDDWQVRGLDSQDTIAHYETVEGKLCVAASNRVPIYAPRFGAVRKMTAPTIAARAVGATPLVDPIGPSIKATQEPAGAVTAPVGPRRRDATKLIDGLHARTRGVAAEKLMPAIDLSGYQLALSRLQNHTTSIRRDDLLAMIGEYMVNARSWESEEGVGVAINGVRAAQARDAKEVQDVTIYETEPGNCSLRICKAASHSAAAPGDIVHFSIRFDNVGNKPIGNLVIMDSLVTRLEYIDGSQQCLLSLASNKSPENNPVKFSAAENEAGSTVLRWEADLPLEAGDSGVITFRCRVR